MLLGALLHICSCGVVPLAVSFYRAGLRTGTVMAFTAATPIINPAAVILSLALLGPRITAAYVLLGLVLPVLLGLATERWGEGPVEADAGAAAVRPLSQEAAPPGGSLGWRVVRALRWGILELGPGIGFYLLVGVLPGDRRIGTYPIRQAPGGRPGGGASSRPRTATSGSRPTPVTAAVSEEPAPRNGGLPRRGPTTPPRGGWPLSGPGPPPSAGWTQAPPEGAPPAAAGHAPAPGPQHLAVGPQLIQPPRGVAPRAGRHHQPPADGERWMGRWRALEQGGKG